MDTPSPPKGWRRLRVAIGATGTATGLGLMLWGILDQRDVVIVAGATLVSMTGLLPVGLAGATIRIGPLVIVPGEQSPERDAIRATQERMGGLARLVCDDSLEADEIAEDALADLLLERGTLAPGQFGPYALERFFELLETAAVRRRLKALLAPPERPRELRPPAADASPGARFRAQFPEYGPRERAAIILGFLCGLPVDEVASLVSLPQEAVQEILTAGEARLPPVLEGESSG